MGELEALADELKIAKMFKVWELECIDDRPVTTAYIDRFFTLLELRWRMRLDTFSRAGLQVIDEVDPKRTSKFWYTKDMVLE